MTDLLVKIGQHTRAVVNDIGKMDSSDAGLIAMAISAGYDPKTFVTSAFGYLASSAKRQLIQHIFDMQQSGAGGTGSAIIPGSKMAYGKRPGRGYSKRSNAASTYRKPTRKRAVYKRKPAYKKRMGGYKKKANPTLSLILKGLRNQ